MNMKIKLQASVFQSQPWSQNPGLGQVAQEPDQKGLGNGVEVGQLLLTFNHFKINRFTWSTV